MLDFSAGAHTIIGNALLKNEEYEPEICALCETFLFRWKDEKNIFIDVGANIGFYPLYAEHYAASHNICLDCYAHEPLPELYETAIMLQQKNNIHYELRKNALSNFIGSAKFYVSGKTDASNSLVEGFRKPKDIINVDVSTLDNEYFSLLSKRAYDNVLLMIDVECSEPNVLRGATNILHAFRPVIICEILFGRTEKEIQPILEASGYAFFRYDGTKWIRTEEIIGDASYQFRDYLFIPAEKTEEFPL